MYWRHEHIVRLSAWPTKVEARHFNLAKRALARFGGELRFAMRGLRSLDLIVQEGAWIIVDRSLNDLPIAAWTEFQDSETRGLHQPVICELRYYHGHAGLVVKKALRRLEEELGALLDGDDGGESGRVIAFRPRGG